MNRRIKLLLKVIKEKCWACSSENLDAVKGCKFPLCPLFKFRLSGVMV